MTEKTEKHTPGPWVHYDDSDSSVHRHQIVAFGKTVAHIYCTNGHEGQDAANARLITAAPELLAACEEFVRKVEAGEARSTRSYEQMKAAVGLATAAEFQSHRSCESGA